MAERSTRHGGAGAESVCLADALARIARAYRPVAAVESVGLPAAISRILAEDIVAAVDVPAFDQSAVDGYAFRHADLADAAGRPFRLVGTAVAGHPFAGAPGPGEAVRILTGGAMPAGADTVAMQEHVRLAGDGLVVPETLAAGENCRKAGEDIVAGAPLFAAGRRLGAAEIGVLASVGRAKIAVRAPLRVAVFSTGDELVDPGRACAEGQRYDSNRPALIALAQGLGTEVSDLGILPDRRDRIARELAAAAAGFDAILTSGGMSVGDEDHVRPAVEALGELDFWKVAIKPGHPVAAGHVAGTPFFGLPGNPAAALITFVMLVRPALLRLAGAEAPAPRRFPVAADFALRRRPGRREYLRATLHVDSEGRQVARRIVRDGSAVLTAVAACDGLVELPETLAEVAPGAMLPFIPKSELGL